MNELPTLVIGDVHGHFDRLEALLVQEDTDNFDCTIIQVGDLGHFGGHSGDPDGDQASWFYANAGWVDHITWGNHDRAVVDERHIFGGFEPPDPEIASLMNRMERSGQLSWAIAVHGHLITHAGIHPAYEDEIPADVEEAAEYINSLHAAADLLSDISYLRGGSALQGGILWRDISEDCSTKWPQVFGHSADPQGVVREDDGNWCVDIGGKSQARLAGLWLPEKRVVRVDL